MKNDTPASPDAADDVAILQVTISQYKWEENMEKNKATVPDYKNTKLVTRQASNLRSIMQKPLATSLYRILMGILLSIWMITNVSSVCS